jgi:DNA-binding MarR family transcriptional regulator
MKSARDVARVQNVARDCIANKVRLLNRAVTTVYDDALRPHGLKITQMIVLITVSNLDGASPGAVGRFLHMEKSTLSRNVDRMRARGWLEAVPSDDGRSVELRVTPSGERLLREAHGAWDKAQRRALAMLGEEGVAGINRTVAQVTRSQRGRR